MRRPGRKAPLTEYQAHNLNHAFDYAVALLARRDYSTHELKKKLAERGYTEHAYEVVVDDLESMGKINNERYGQNVVAYRARRGHGPVRIRSQLQKSGLSRAAIDEAVKGEDAPDFLALARAARQRIGFAERNLQVQQKSLEVTRKRFGGGLESGLDLAQAEAHFGRAEGRLGARHHDVAAGDQARPTAERRAVDSRDGRFRQLVEGLHQLRQRPGVGEIVLLAVGHSAAHPVEVRPGREASAGPGQDDGAHGLVDPEARELDGQFGDQPVVRRGVVEAMTRQESAMVQIALIDLAVDLREKESIATLRELSGDAQVNGAVRERAQRGLAELE